MKDELKRHGNFSLSELLTTDLSSAQKFYGELLGWTFTETKNIHGSPYIVIFREGDVIGGMMLKEGMVPDEVPPLWDTYISVDDVDASALMVKNLGGEVVVPPTDIPSVGRFCVIKDPQGATLNLITYIDS